MKFKVGDEVILKNIDMLDGFLNDQIGFIYEIYEDSTNGTSYIIKVNKTEICGISEDNIEIYDDKTWDNYFSYILAIRKRKSE